MIKQGRVYLVGAGCGDYDLITLRGKNLLSRCDVVIYDSLIDIRALDFAPSEAEKICVGKRAGVHSETQESINELLVQKAKEGKIVVRLKGGDPFVFGRGGEEIIILKKNNVEYEVVPGISSAIAVPELAGIPVTHRKISRSVHIITGHTADDLMPENIGRYASLDGTLVFLMGLKNLRKISECLIRNGKEEDTPVAVISNGAGADQRIVRAELKNIADEVQKHNLNAPAVIVAGKVADFDFARTITLPLRNVSVAVTGTKSFFEKLSSYLYSLGADVINAVNLNVLEYADNSDFDNALLNIDKYSRIVLTSINGAEIFFKRLKKLRIDIRSLANIKFSVIGRGTAAALERHGIFAELVPDKYTSEALGNELAKTALPNERFLILRAKQGSELLTQIFDENNISYDDIKTYDVAGGFKNCSESIAEADFITFASASGVKAFFDSGFKISSASKIICIGDITAKALTERGIKNIRISKTSSAESVAETILREVDYAQIQTT